MTMFDRFTRASLMAACTLAAGLSCVSAAQAQPANPPPSSAPPPAPPPAGQPPIVQGSQPTTIVVQQGATAPQYDNMRGDWTPGQPVPPGYHPDKEPMIPLIIAGGSVLGSTWLLFGVLPGAIIVATCDANDLDCGHVQAAGGTLFIPAVGPFVSMAIFGANDNLSAPGGAVLAIDGLVQCGGLAMLIAGFAVKHDILVRDRIGGIDVQMTPAPVQLGASGAGLGLVGAF